MENIVLLLIDSLNYRHVKDSPIELMPFLKQLQSKGIYCDNMYSQAPYTEAANMNIYCGTDVLDDGGYIFRYKDAKKTIFEAMKERGYKTYYNSFQPQCHPSSVRRGIDDIYYNVGYDMSALWPYRLSHYSDLYKTGQLKDEDYRVLEEIFSDNLREWIRFTEDIADCNASTNMIRENSSNYQALQVKELVTEQLNRFEQDRKRYINSVLQEGHSHYLFKIPAFVQDYKTKNRSSVEWIRKKYRPLIKRIKRMDFWLNIKNCHGLMKGPLKQLKVLLQHPSKVTAKNFLKSGLLVWNQLFDSDLFDRIKNDCDGFKNAPSLRTHINHYINWAKSQSTDTPHFAFMHVDDIHNPEVFFTYDSSDTDLLTKEYQVASELLDNIPKTYSGSLSHDLSLKYIDGVIKYFYDELERTGLSDNTYVLICADHGFSFSGNPLRESFVVNMYLENYNIPFVITGPGLSHKEVKGLHASKDIPATLCGLVSGTVPNEFNGIDVIHSDESYPFLQIEYCGGGCPDLSRRDLFLAAYDSRFFVGVLVYLDEPITYHKITEIYDLSKDPKQLHNLVGKIENYQEIEYLIDALEKRKKRISEKFSKTSLFLTPTI